MTDEEAITKTIEGITKALELSASVIGMLAERVTALENTVYEIKPLEKENQDAEKGI